MERARFPRFCLFAFYFYIVFMLSKVLSAATQGVGASMVEVEVDLLQGMPTEQLLGLPSPADSSRPWLGLRWARMTR